MPRSRAKDCNLHKGHSVAAAVPMTVSEPPQNALAAPRSRFPRSHALWLLGLWLAIFVASLGTPPLLDDADATHGQAAQAMLHTGDWVTLHVDGVRYLEKPPLPYWLTAISMKLFGENSFAVHLPLALTVLGLALLGYFWSRRAFNPEAAFLTGIFTLTSVGIFLFTRIFIPDALLALLLAASLYFFLRALDRTNPRAGWSAYLLWIALACAVLTKGLVAPVFFFAAAMLYFTVTRTWHDWRRMRLFTGLLLFFAIAAPWHILAGLRNTGGADGHGFFWFYFINEHVLRFLGKRIPRDYNKLPWYLYWSLHIVWLFPWSLFVPAALRKGWLLRGRDLHSDLRQASTTFTRQTIWILVLFSAFVLVFFSLSTNQEYYTFPVYLPLIMLTAAALSEYSKTFTLPEPLANLARKKEALSGPCAGCVSTPGRTPALTFAFVAFTVLGVLVAAALAYGLWSARHEPFVPDIGSLLAHRDVGGYTLSMSHFFDLTGASFAALRLPASLALIAFAVGPTIALLLYRRSKLHNALITVACTTALFLIAAHIALVRFGPMLSSEPFAATIKRLEANHEMKPGTLVAIYGDQAFGSSISFYLHDRHVLLIDGRTTSMYFGSTFPDAPPIFWTHQQLAAQWGKGPRKVLFVPLERRNEVDQLLGSRAILLQELSGKALYTDRPLLNTSTH